MRIIFISPWFPNPPDNGAKIRVFNVLRHLSINHLVTLISFSSGAIKLDGLEFCENIYTFNNDPFTKPKIIQSLRFFFPDPIVSLKTKGMDQLVKNVTKNNNYSVGIAFTSITAPYLLNKNFPVILDIDATFTEYAQERLRVETNPIKKIQARVSLYKTIKYERKMVSRSEATIALTALSKKNNTPVFIKAKRLLTIGNGVNLSDYPYLSIDPQPNTLIYNGSLTFQANYDAVQWFLDEVMEKIIKENPSVNLKITGKVEGVNLNELPLNNNVMLTGYLEDIRPEIAKSWICVVPLRIGGGQRMKILEAMALGTPVVSTTKGVEGLAVVHNEHVLIADTPDTIAENVVKLLRDPVLRKRLSVNARALVEREYNWDSVLSQFNSIVEHVGGKSI